MTQSYAALHLAWPRAGIELGGPNPAGQKVACPSCGHEYLSFRNLPSDENTRE